MSNDVVNRLILRVTLILLVAPVLIDLAISGPEGCFRYFAPDAFYYHTVARNIAELGHISFDQVHPTNGFHPIWQFALAGLYWLSSAANLDESSYLTISLLLSVGLVATGIRLLGLAMLQSKRDIPAAFLLLPVGLYALILIPDWVYTLSTQPNVPRVPLYGTLWSYMNGMESGVLLACYGWLAWSFSRQEGGSVRRGAMLGGITAAITLSRLDHILIVSGFALHACVQLWQSKWSREAIREFVSFGLAAALPIVAYLAFNLFYAGTLIPVSGAEKSSFPTPDPRNLRIIWAMLTMSSERDVLHLSRLCRTAQLLIPFIAAAAFLARAWIRPRTDRFHLFLSLTAIGILLLGLYNTLFVDLFAMGPWYLPISVIFVSLALVDFLATPRENTSAGIYIRIALASALGLLIFLPLHRSSDNGLPYADFYFREAARVREFYGDSIPKIVEFDDGIIAFSTGFPTMSGFGFTLDKEAHAAKSARRFGPLLLERGFDRAATLVYPHRYPMFRSGIPDVHQYYVVTEYQSSAGRFQIVRLTRRPRGPVVPQSGGR